MKTWIKTLTLGTVLAMGLSACEDTATPEDLIDEAALRADVALVSADAMFQDLAAMQRPVALGLPGGGPDLGPSEGGGSYSWSREGTFFDENDLVQAEFDPLLTSYIQVAWEFERDVDHPFWTADVERSRNYTVTGLLGEETERTWNGTGSGDVFKSRHPDEGVTRTYDMEMDAEASEVVRKVPRSENPYPISGTITRHVHVVITENGAVVEEKDVTSIITFNGTQFATITVGEDTWEIDLAERGTKKRFGKRG